MRLAWAGSIEGLAQKFLWIFQYVSTNLRTARHVRAERKT